MGSLGYTDYSDDFIMHQSIVASTLPSSNSVASPEVGTNMTPGDVLNDTFTSALNPVLTSDGLDYADVKLFDGYSAALLHFASACCIIFILVGIPGNLITIIALFRCKKVRNATAVFIINLSVSDLMFCCFNLPLAASMFWQRAWRHGKLLCRLYPLMRYGLMAVSLFTVLAITINRYVMIGHPRLYPKLYRKQFLGLMVACTWVFGFGALVATWLGMWGRFGLDTHIGSCSILPDAQGHSPKEFLFIVAFVIPCLAIVVCYARIFYIVRKTALKSRLTTRNNTVTTTTITASGSTSGNGRRTRGVSSSGYEDNTVPGKFRKRCNFSSADDSALGSSSAAGITAEKTSTMGENGHTSPPYNNNTSSEVHIQVPDNLGMKLEAVKRNSNVPNPNLLSPASASSMHLPLHKKMLGEPSSSSGVDMCNGEDDEEGSSRSVTPTSMCSSSVDPGGTNAASTPNTFPKRSSYRSRRRRDRMPSVAVNSALSHVAAVFRRGSNLKCSPRRQSTVTNASGMALPGKMTPKDRKLLKMILVIFTSFVICYLPITISKTFHETIDHHGLNIAGYLLIYLSTCINPIIYVVMSSEYRQAYKNLLMCRGYSADSHGHNQAGSGGAGRSVSQRA